MPVHELPRLEWLPWRAGCQRLGCRQLAEAVQRGAALSAALEEQQRPAEAVQRC